jgi:iron complex outermembrane receptor protein
MSVDFKRTTSLTRRLGAVIVTTALFPATSAFAQQRPTAGQGEHTLQEIIVTAERREARLQDVPLSVTALTPETLQRANITSTRDLAMVTPGLRIEATGIFVQPNIRGITTVLSFPTAEANIATYVDGVYQQNMLMSFYELPDVRQVEVLKGPQGTLFGRNATGGAILINTLKPDLNRATGQGTVGYGRFDDTVAKGFFSVPIIQDRLAVSLTAYTHHNDGWARNLLQGDRREASHISGDLLRAKIRFKPWDGADFVLAGTYSHSNDWDQLRDANLNGNNVATLFGVPQSQIASRPWQFSQEFDSYSKTTQRMISLNGDIQLGPGTLTTISSYRRQRDVVPLDGDNGPLPLAQTTVNSNSKAWSQELLYATDQLGRFRGTFGFFYYHFDGGIFPLDINHGFTDIWQRDKTNAYAGFGEISYNITDRLILTGGIRYSDEKKYPFVTFTFGQPTLIGPIPPLAPPKAFHSWTPKASILYKVTDTTNVYFTYSQGFKSGLFNTVSAQPTPVLPEKVKSYEVGFKSHPVRTVSVSGAGFFYNYTDLQIPTIIQLPGGTFAQIVNNAASAHIYGIELNGDWQATDELRLSAGGTWLHARYRSFPNAAVNVPKPGGGGNVTTVEDVSGFSMVRSPDWSGNVTATYTKKTNAGTFEVSGVVFYSSKIFFDSGNLVEQKAYTNINASLSWNPPNQPNVQLRAWGKNLTDKAVIDSTVISNTSSAVHYAPPRMWGVEASYRF